MDPNQVLAHCHRIRGTMKSLVDWIKLTQFRLQSLDYIRNFNANEDEIRSQSEGAGRSLLAIESSLLNFFPNLVKLRDLSQLMVNQLEHLEQKVKNLEPNSTIDYHVGTQQLMFFTSELYENIQPKIDSIFEIAYTRELIVANDQRRGVLGVFSPGTATAAKKDQQRKVGGLLPLEAQADLRARDALIRLKQSMGENESLIASIANNVEHTKLTIDSIYESLEKTKVGLETTQRDTMENLGQLKANRRIKLICYLTFGFLLLLVVYMIVYSVIDLIN